MINSHKVFALITARGGSKRLPRKNLLPLANKPLVVWSIEAGLKSNYIERVFVSSDDDEILALSGKVGATALKRPKHLSSDTAKSVDVIVHALQKVNCDYEYVILLQPTSPLRNKNHIDEAFDLLTKKKADAIVSVCKTEHSPLWSNTLPDDGSMKDFMSEKIKNSRSQDLPVFYRTNGAIFICKIERLLNEKTLFIKDNIFAFLMDRESSIDIDEKFDFQVAEYVIRNND